MHSSLQFMREHEGKKSKIERGDRTKKIGHISKWMKAASTVPLHFLRDAIQIFFRKLKQWKNPLLDIWILGREREKKKRKILSTVRNSIHQFESNVTFVKKEKKKKRKKKKHRFSPFNFSSLEGNSFYVSGCFALQESIGIGDFCSEERRRIC